MNTRGFTALLIILIATALLLFPLVRRATADNSGMHDIIYYWIGCPCRVSPAADVTGTLQMNNGVASLSYGGVRRNVMIGGGIITDGGTAIGYTDL